MRWRIFWRGLIPVLLLAIALSLASCSPGGPAAETTFPSPERPGPSPSPTEPPEDIRARLREESLSAAGERLVAILEEGFDCRGFLLWLEKTAESDIIDKIASASDKKDLDRLIYGDTGRSLAVARYEFVQASAQGSVSLPSPHRVYYAQETPGDSIILAFGGDVNLMEGGYVMPVFRALGSDLGAVLTGGLLQRMRAADLLLLNSEFAFTDRGCPLPGKTYTFRSAPENVTILKDMGVDVAFLANNHVFDYGPQGLEDTLASLEGAGIPGIGAGMDIDEAKEPVYYIVKGRMVSFIGAGCIERYTVFTPGAGEGSPGIFRADEINCLPLLELIGRAAENSDFVVVNLHWGIESTTVLEDYQPELGRMCLDAGADAVIGAHPHVLQGAEFYRGKPIVYSTGNFWFSTTANSTCLIEIEIDKNNSFIIRFVPCSTSGGKTALLEGDAAQSLMSYYESISFGVELDENGVMSPGK